MAHSAFAISPVRTREPLPAVAIAIRGRQRGFEERVLHPNRKQEPELKGVEQ